MPAKFSKPCPKWAKIVTPGGEHRSENIITCRCAVYRGKALILVLGESLISIRDYARRKAYLAAKPHPSCQRVEDNAFHLNRPSVYLSGKALVFGLANPRLHRLRNFKQKITKETKIPLRPRQNNFVAFCLICFLLLFFGAAGSAVATRAIESLP